MFRILLAALAFSILSQAVAAQGSLPPEKALRAYSGKVRAVVSAAVHQVGGIGRARIDFLVSASGKVSLESVNATDKGLKQRLRRKLGSLRVPPPPPWADPPLLFTVPVVFDPS
jgi:hypothetical protein